MLCHCGLKAFSYTKYCEDNGNKCIYLIGKCPRTEEDTKKRKKCNFSEKKLLESKPLIVEEKPSTGSSLIIETQEKDNTYYAQELRKYIFTVKTCQDTGCNFDKYTNKILYISSILNIPPYIPEYHTIEEYYRLAEYYINNPVPKPIKVPFKPINFFPELSYLFNHKHINKHTKTQNKTSKEVIRKISSLADSSNFITGGRDVDEVQEDSLDFEEYESDDEQDDQGGYDSGVLSD